MTIPTRHEAALILRSLNPPDWLLVHSAAVADVGAFLAQKVEEQGHAISTGLVEAAALLHDIGKALPKGHPLKGQGHSDAGAHWLSDNGYGELAGAVAAHPVTRLAENEHYATWSRTATVEERVVAYADKRATENVVPMEDRFQYWIDKHGDTDVMRLAFERAEILEAGVCAAAGIKPVEVERLRWAEAALQAGS